MADGVVAGGGLAYLQCAAALDELAGHSQGDEKLGIKALAASLGVPFRQILKNAGQDPDQYFEKVCQEAADWGFNVNTQKMERFFESGIIDSVKSARAAIDSAVSVCSMLLLTKCAITDAEL